jgi:hypothetical protein
MLCICRAFFLRLNPNVCSIKRSIKDASHSKLKKILRTVACQETS